MYSIEILSAFLFFLVFGLIFSPFLGGCLVVSFIIFALGLILVFFSLNFVWFILAGFILYGIGFISKIIKWYKLPDFTKYVELHPNCNMDEEVCCYNCGSEKTTHSGLFNKGSKFRYYICSNCGTVLFRFKVL